VLKGKEMITKRHRNYGIIDWVIFRGGEGVERLVKEEILQPLDFTDLEKCVDCIKGKFVKKIKKYVTKRSAECSSNNSHKYKWSF
jgi:hypothetical protein